MIEFVLIAVFTALVILLPAFATAAMVMVLGRLFPRR